MLNDGGGGATFNAPGIALGETGTIRPAREWQARIGPPEVARGSSGQKPGQGGDEVDTGWGDAMRIKGQADIPRGQPG
ncbi:hypothetical protein O1611_g2679 [Lasiodiplodia mahajangana]|uniref:Uncharacterized protein n=1 Tax=Lasiodiplodia mahajangana TaxID=1108764 RepID=A0ACC2JTT3_9PEZI|nr:hypothetical protein O1611_g2679 [Lasiodiplodia mahajangana]